MPSLSKIVVFEFSIRSLDVRQRAFVFARSSPPTRGAAAAARAGIVCGGGGEGYGQDQGSC